MSASVFLVKPFLLKHVVKSSYASIVMFSLCFTAYNLQADFLEYFSPILANCTRLSVINSNQVQFILEEQLEEA